MQEMVKAALNEALAEGVKRLFAGAQASLVGSREKNGILERTHFRLGLQELITIYRAANDVVNEVVK